MSRIAGMEIPGNNSIINSYEINFKKPIFLPSSINVKAILINSNQVNVKFFDEKNNVLYAEGYYIFSLNIKSKKKFKSKKNKFKQKNPPKSFITGSTGDMGKTLFRELKSAITLNLNKGYYYNSLKKKVRKFSIQNVVYCGWPTQDNQNILSDNDTDKLTNIYLKKPVEDIIEIGKLLMKHGNKNSKLILIGSTSSKAGRHNYKNPFYSLGKNILNSLNEILSLELGKKEMLSVVLEFDIIDGGMNNSLSEMNKDLARDRVPSGKIPTMKEAVKQIKWIMSNKSTLINGSSIKLSGGALP